jgi:Protein of unknown function (DUF2793).
MASLGGFDFQSSFPRHGWGDAMSRNFLKMATLFPPTVVSRSTPLPTSAVNNTAYIDPSTGLINVWFDGGWNTISPKEGVLVYVADEQAYVHFNHHGQWVTAIDLNATQPPVPRSLNVYVPGRIRPDAPVFRYVAAMEFTLPAGAIGSTALLEVPPVGADVTFSVTGGSGSGTITFANGSTVGVFNIPNDIVTLPSELQAEPAGAQALTIMAPEDLHGAEGLTISLRGQVRPLHAG